MSDNGIPKVYGCIAAVSAEMAKTGISKDRSNTQQNYKFRGIDDVYNALAPLISKHGLVIIPRIVEREVVERQTQKGSTLFYVTVAAEFDFVAAADGSKVTARSYGEAMDSGDKATNKAMSAAYKYTAFQAFCIPTEGDNDADATTHADTRPLSRPTAPPRPPEGYNAWMLSLTNAAEKGTAALQAVYGAADKKAFRQYLAATNAESWEDIKAAAKDNDAASVTA